MNNLRIGVSVNVITLPQTVREMAEIGASAFMCRTTNSRGVGGKPIENYEVEEGRALMCELGVTDIVVHAPSSINLASGRESIANLGLEMLYAEIVRGGLLGAKYVVVHPGRNANAPISESINQIVRLVTSHKIIFNLGRFGMMILFETMYGQTGEVGSYIEEMKSLLETVPVSMRHYFGICLDTSHLWGAGYDIRHASAVLEHISSVVGLNAVRVVHINGANSELGSHQDRHTNIGATDEYPRGRDYIGAEYLFSFVRNPVLSGKIFILETPVIDGFDVHRAEIQYLTQDIV